MNGQTCALFIRAAIAAAHAADSNLDTAKIEQLTGLKGTFIEQENVFNVSLPRTDIKPVVAGTTVNTEMGLTAWVAFTKADGHAMVMGDIVLLEGEVSPVMSSALNNGLDQIMRTSGSFKDGVYKIVIGRKATMAGVRMADMRPWGRGPLTIPPTSKFCFSP